MSRNAEQGLNDHLATRFIHRATTGDNRQDMLPQTEPGNELHIGQGMDCLPRRDYDLCVEVYENIYHIRQ